ncbi:MAG: tRNA dimethylallyltransferase [Myxococcales bacterium]
MSVTESAGGADAASGAGDLTPLVALVGPTASGKSALALELARRGRLGPVTILSCDSMQVYRGLDIGTAKPSAEERAAVPHRLLDLDTLPLAGATWQGIDAGVWARAADSVLAEERAAGRLPLVVGGTGLWLRALLWGLAEVPSVPPEVRARITAALAAEGLPALHARLREVDPELGARLPPRDTQRILRALEVYEAHGTPLSQLQQRHGFATLRYRPLILALDIPRPTLAARIDARVDAMLAAGLVAEVRRLLEAGVDPDCRPLQAPGYRDVVAHLQGSLDAAAMRAAIQLAHRRYAKRQLTWLRGMEGVTWVAPDASDIETRVAHFLGVEVSR